MTDLPPLQPDPPLSGGNFMLAALEASGHEILVFECGSAHLVDANHAAIAGLGLNLAVLRKMSVSDFMENQTEASLNTLTASLLPGSRIEFEQTFLRSDGSTYICLSTAARIGDSDRWCLVSKNRTGQIEAARLQKATMVRFQEALEVAETSVWEWDVHNDVFKISEVVKRWLGLPEHIMSEEAIYSRLHPDDKPRLRQALKLSLDDDIDFSIECRLFAKDGRLVWVHTRGIVQRDEAGMPVLMVGTISNVTGRKEAELAIADSVTKFELVLDNITDGIVTMNSDGEVLTLNPPAVRLLGRTIVGTKIVSKFLLSDGILTSWSSVADRFLREGKLVSRVGGHVPIEFAVGEASLAKEKIYTLVLRNIARRKRYEQEILAAKEHAEQAARSKSEFLATMSHEIRTPMNGILGMTQLMLDTDLSEEQRDSARIIHSSGESLLTIINDVLDFSKIEAGKLEIEAELFDLRTAIAEVFEIVQNKADDSRVSLLIDFPLNIPHRVIADAGRVRQILLNLVGNAIKFTADGYIKVRIEQEDRNADTDQILLKIHVIDTGIGVAKDQQKLLFDSFTQADASTTRKFGGTGLGLAICRKLVALMGGELGMESEPGEGSRFWFSLPVGIDRVDIDPRMLNRFDGLRTVLYMADSVETDLAYRQLKALGCEVEVSRNMTRLLEDDYNDQETLMVLPDTVKVQDFRALTAKARAGGNLKLLVISSVWSRRREIFQDLGVQHFVSYPVDYPALIRELGRSLDPANADNEINRDRVADTGANFSHVRILLAEDNAVNQKVITRMLDKLGCTVDVAANGQEALDMWHSLPYNMILMDCRMPELDGMSATREIRQREQHQERDRIPIIAMTANVMEGDKEACIDAGMDDYTAKPIRIEALRNVISRWHEGTV